MKQNLFKAICPVCKKKALNFIEWVDIKNKEVIPDDLKEDICPECLLEILKKQQRQTGNSAYCNLIYLF